ncbi:hypothetical protein BC940DRAFT_290660 [Gongronella butleri]|nr:hypothetical protein BC940DRAFT_290660 [Gongronella butleri]
MMTDHLHNDHLTATTSAAAHRHIGCDDEDDVAMLQFYETSDFCRYDQSMYGVDVDAGHHVDEDDLLMHDYDAADGHEVIVDDEGEEDDEFEVDGDDQEEDHDDSSLLRLIVGVQMYLSEQEPAEPVDRADGTPLMDLQYRMYTYLRQKAFELGVDSSALNEKGR